MLVDRLDRNRTAGLSIKEFKDLLDDRKLDQMFLAFRYKKLGAASDQPKRKREGLSKLLHFGGILSASTEQFRRQDRYLIHSELTHERRVIRITLLEERSQHYRQ